MYCEECYIDPARNGGNHLVGCPNKGRSPVTISVIVAGFDKIIESLKTGARLLSQAMESHVIDVKHVPHLTTEQAERLLGTIMAETRSQRSEWTDGKWRNEKGEVVPFGMPPEMSREEHPMCRPERATKEQYVSFIDGIRNMRASRNSLIVGIDHSDGSDRSVTFQYDTIPPDAASRDIKFGETVTVLPHVPTFIPAKDYIECSMYASGDTLVIWQHPITRKAYDEAVQQEIDCGSFRRDYYKCPGCESKKNWHGSSVGFFFHLIRCPAYVGMFDTTDLSFLGEKTQ